MSRPCILNGFGRSLGDSILGLQALRIAIDEGALRGRPVLARLPGLPPLLQELYTLQDMADIATLDWADETPGPTPAAFARHAPVIDIRDFAFDADFRGVSMIDYFLGKLGVDPRGIASARKRNSWLAPRLALPPVAARYVLLCPNGSIPLRSMPAAVHERVLAWLRERVDLPVRSQALLPPEETLAGLCRLVAGAALVVSTDTAMLHLADAFGVPCLAFFPTHRPEWRVRDYPLCRSLFLAPALPPALEFPRDEADVAAAHAGWLRAPEAFDWWDRELDAMIACHGIPRRV